MKRLNETLDALDGHLFSPPRAERGSRAFQWIFLAALFLLGAWFWARFLNQGRLRLTAEDWPRQCEYFSVLAQAVTDGRIPWHVSRQFYGIDSFLGVPELVLSPQILLLPFMDAGRFVLVNVLLLYAVGFAGLLLIRRRWRLSAAAFALLFLLFNFNGHIISHLAVGHQWYGYFFLPFFLLLAFEMAEGKRGLRLPILTALALNAILLQGSFHMMNWCLIFLALMILFIPAARRAGLWALLFTALLAAWRVVPGAIELHGGGYSFRNGYPSLYDLFLGLTRMYGPDGPQIGGIVGPERWWEYDLYIGLPALTLLLGLGIAVRRLRSWRLEGTRFQPLDAPMIAMAICSLGYFWAVVAMLPIPLANVERVSSRFLLIPFLMLLVIACARAQEGLDRLGRWRWLCLPLLAEIGFELFNHARLWRLSELERLQPIMPYDVSIRIIERAEPLYQWGTSAAAVLSLATLAALLVLLIGRKDETLTR